MLPMRAVRLQLGELIAADATTLGPVAANKIALIAGDFVPSEDLVIGDLTFATFTGSTPKAGAVGAQPVGIDPATQEQVVTNQEPAGGWRWECTADPVTPETITGYALTDNAGAVLLAVALLPDGPLTISAAGEEINIGKATFRFVLEPMA